MKLSPIDIHKEIKNTPLYQQEDLFKHYEGIDIKGIGSLCSIDLDSFTSIVFREDKLENGIYVHMLTYNNETNSSFYPTIWCYADLNKYPELKFKKKHQKISFIGKVKKVQANDIYVINPKFTFENEEANSNKVEKGNEKMQSEKTPSRSIHIERLEIIKGDKVNRDKIEQYGKRNKTSIKNGDSESFLSKFLWQILTGIISLVVIYIAFIFGFNN